MEMEEARMRDRMEMEMAMERRHGEPFMGMHAERAARQEAERAAYEAGLRASAEQLVRCCGVGKVARPATGQARLPKAQPRNASRLISQLISAYLASYLAAPDHTGGGSRARYGRTWARDSACWKRRGLGAAP